MAAAKILVVEDNLDTRELLHLYLMMGGFSVITAEDGREGLDAAEAEHPDLIITDISMPHLNGIEMTRLLRAKADFESVPIVVLTAHRSESLVGRCMPGRPGLCISRSSWVRSLMM
jgi:DNA-binding response OmpR family regulator